MHQSIYAKQRVAKKNRQDKIKQKQELEQHLLAASKSLKLKMPMDIHDMSLQKQVEMLEAYASRLQVEMDDFAATWGSDGAWGVSRLQTEIKSVLSHVARLIIKIGREG